MLTMLRMAILLVFALAFGIARGSPAILMTVLFAFWMIPESYAIVMISVTCVDR